MFGDGESDARFGTDLALRKTFYQLNPEVKSFRVKLNVTKKINNGFKDIYAYGNAELDLEVNDPPVNGTCDIRGLEIGANGAISWRENARDGRALLDVMQIRCQGWVDPNAHDIVKFDFTGNKDVIFSSPGSRIYQKVTSTE